LDRDIAKVEKKLQDYNRINKKSGKLKTSSDESFDPNEV
jgi:hypothetical protein